MKRKSFVAGLMILLVLVALASLAGPASAKQDDQKDQWKYFDATLSPDESAHVYSMTWPSWKVEPPGRLLGERFEGPYATWDENGEPILELSGYMVVETNGVMTLQGGTRYTMQYQNKSTLYVGAVELPDPTEDYAYGVWEMTAIGTWRLDLITGEESQHLEGHGHGVSGPVKGWVMNFTSDIPAGAVDASSTGHYLAKK